MSNNLRAIGSNKRSSSNTRRVVDTPEEAIIGVAEDELTDLEKDQLGDFDEASFSQVDS